MPRPRSPIFADGRRRLSYDSFRLDKRREEPGNIRSPASRQDSRERPTDPYRERGRDHTWERDRDREWEAGRQGNFDRERASGRESESQREGEREYRPRGLRADTLSQAQPTPMAKDSPLGLRSSAQSARTPQSEPDDRRTTSSVTLISAASTSSQPAAHPDPKAQDILNTLLEWDESTQKRVVLRLQKEQFEKESRSHQRDANKLSGGHQRNEFSAVIDLQAKIAQRDSRNLEIVNKRMSELDAPYKKSMESLAALLYGVIGHQPKTVAPSPQEVALEIEAKVNAARESILREVSAQFADERKNVSTALETKLADTMQRIDDQELKLNCLKEANKKLNQENCELKTEMATLSTSLQQHIRALQTQTAISEELQCIIDTINRVSEKLEAQRSAITANKTRLDETKKVTSALDDSTAHIKDAISRWETEWRDKLVSLDFVTLRQVSHSWIANEMDKTQSKRLNAEGNIQHLSDNLGSIKGVEVSAIQPTDSTKLNCESATIGTENYVTKAELQETEKTVKKVVEDMGHECGTMIDELDARFVKLEEKAKQITPYLEKYETQISSLEATCEQSRQKETNAALLTERVTKVEEQQEETAAQLQQSSTTVQQALKAISGNAVALQSSYDQHAKQQQWNAEFGSRLETLAWRHNTMDAQWTNLTSKNLADHILRQLDPYGPAVQRVEARVEKMQNSEDKINDRVKALEETEQTTAGRVNTMQEKVTKLNDAIGMISNVVSELNPLRKRGDSEHRSGPEQKKRKLDLTGSIVANGTSSTKQQR